jgi:hypothetical protein
MKKIYLILSLLLAFGGVTQLMAQETVTLDINKKTGSWTASGSPAYASEYATYNYSTTDITPGVRIQHWTQNNKDHRNNMYFYDNQNLGLYSTYGTTTWENYRIYPSRGYYVSNFTLDFIPGKHANYAMNGVRVWGDEDESTAVGSPDADNPGHFSMDFTEKEYVVLTVGQWEENGNPIFAHTYNFTVTLTPRDPFDVIMEDIDALMEEYRDYTEDHPQAFVVGTEIGNYGAAEVAAFNEAYSACVFAGTPDYQGTADDLVVLRDALKAAYQAVLDSQVKFVIVDGYYRFRTGINYNDGKMKYMYVEPTAGTTINGKWGTLDDLAENCHALWQLTKGEDGSWDIVSVSTDARFNDNPGTLSEESTWRFQFEEVVMIGEDYYVNIKYADRDPGTYNRIYVHQASHGSGSGTGGNLTLWSPSYPASTSNKMGGSEWVVELVPNDEATEIIAAYAAIKERQKMEREYAKMVETSKTNLEIAKDNPKVTVDDETLLITENSQFSSPWTDPTEGSLDNLLDGDLSTHWHSSWQDGNVPAHTHYLDVALKEATHSLVAMTISRRPVQNDHVTQWSVYGSATPDVYYTQEEIEAAVEGDPAYGKTTSDLKTPGEWHKLADLYTPFGNNKETKTSAPFDTRGYQYLRFYLDAMAPSTRGYGHVSEFQLNPASIAIAENAQYLVMGELATNLEKVLFDQIEVEAADMTDEQFNALKAAYDAFMEKFSDPTELRAAIKTAEASTAGIVVGTNPGEWGPDTDAGALATTVANAKAYDQSGDYTPAQTEQYIEDLNAQAGDILSSANKIEEGKWYRIHFGSKETFEANGWDIENNEATTVEDIHENVYVTNEALWDKFVTVAKHEAEKINIEVAHEPTEEDSSTSKEQEVTLNKVVPYAEDEDILRGAQLYFDAIGDIKDPDCSLFRFVNVGDTAYVIQNKATGLYLRANTKPVYLDITPSLFNVSAIGYGQNLIAATSLSNVKENNLNYQLDKNMIVPYNESAAGSRSGLYIQTIEDVAEDYDGSLFKMNVRPGEIYSYCYPVDMDIDTDDNDGKFYIVTALEIKEDDVNITLSPLAVPNPAGYPVFYILDTPEDYIPEYDPEPMTFKHGSTFVAAPVETGFMRGTFSKQTVGKGYIVTGGNLIGIQQEGHAGDYARNQFYITEEYITNAVVANGTYVADEELLNPSLNVTFTIGDKPVDDAVASVLNQTTKRGELYTIDGRLLGRNVTLKDLKRFGKGLYIIDGIKVTVK